MVLILTITPSFSGQALAATLSFLVLPFLFKLDVFHFLESHFSLFFLFTVELNKNIR